MLVSACQARGWQPEITAIDSLALQAGMPCWSVHTAKGQKWRTPADTDLLWVLGLGSRASFLDKVQLLALAEQKIPVINSPGALAFWHGKYLSTQLGLGQLKIPETLAASRPDWLWSEICRQGGVWVAKPPGGSHGHEVHKIQAGDLASLAVLERLTSEHAYCLVQRYIPEIERGEKRVLLAGQRVIGQYLRLPAFGFKTNLAQGGRPAACTLTPEEKAAMHQLATTLCSKGILFSGVDLCWPWLIEINISSPGGLQTIARLSGQDLSADVIDAIEERLQASGQYAS